MGLMDEEIEKEVTSCLRYYMIFRRIKYPLICFLKAAKACFTVTVVCTIKKLVIKFD